MYNTAGQLINSTREICFHQSHKKHPKRGYSRSATSLPALGMADRALDGTATCMCDHMPPPQGRSNSSHMSPHMSAGAARGQRQGPEPSHKSNSMQLGWLGYRLDVGTLGNTTLQHLRWWKVQQGSDQDEGGGWLTRQRLASVVLTSSVGRKGKRSCCGIARDFWASCNPLKDIFSFLPCEIMCKFAHQVCQSCF